ncbi:hypothetical protein M0R45_019245 [Rubus argutus]|uniref:Uncharacterized protein n=1 Tax=Rubus argutus TaxID=59490 RepID=A0AAW1X7D4_RUBAR
MPPRRCHLEEPSPSSFATPPAPLRLHHLSPSSPPSSDHWSPAGVSNSHGHRLYPRRCKDKEMKEATDHGQGRRGAWRRLGRRDSSSEDRGSATTAALSLAMGTAHGDVPFDGVEQRPDLKWRGAEEEIRQRSWVCRFSGAKTTPVLGEEDDAGCLW